MPARKPETTMVYGVPTLSDAKRSYGSSGIRRLGGVIYEEFLRSLQGPQGRAIYKEMAANCSAARRGLRAILLQILSADWSAQDAVGPDAEEATAFLESNMDDMSFTWSRTLGEAARGGLTYGWSYFPIQYKECLGPGQKDGSKRSKYNDGLVRWRKWQPIAQDTLDRWEFDEDGGVQGLWQRDQWAGSAGEYIPISRSLLFTNEGALGNPEGESLLRSAYEPYYRWKRMRFYESVGAERDLAGVPMIQITDQSLPIWDSTNPDMAALLSYLKDIVTTVRVDEQSGLIIPYGAELSLLSSGGAKQFDVDKSIRRLTWEILGTMLAQFLELGQTETGSYSKSKSDQDFFLSSIETILVGMIADTINRYEVPRLFGLNGDRFKLEALPQLVPGDIRTPDLTEIAEPLGKLVTAGLITPDPLLEAWLRQQGRLPEQEEEAEAGAEGGTLAKAAAGVSRLNFMPRLRSWWRARRRQRATEKAKREGDEVLHYTLDDILGKEGD